MLRLQIQKAVEACALAKTSNICRRLTHASCLEACRLERARRTRELGEDEYPPNLTRMRLQAARQSAASKA